LLDAGIQDLVLILKDDIMRGKSKNKKTRRIALFVPPSFLLFMNLKIYINI